MGRISDRMSKANTLQPRKLSIVPRLLFIGMVTLLFTACGPDRPANPENMFLTGNNGESLFATDYIKSRLRDPESYQHIVTMHERLSTGDYQVGVKYRSRNRMGGTDVCFVILDLDSTATLVKGILRSEECQ